MKRTELVVLLFLFAYMPACWPKKQLETDLRPMKYPKTLAEIDQSDEWKWMENDTARLESWLMVKQKMTQSYLAQSESKAALHKALNGRLDRTVPISNAVARNGWIFFYWNKPGTDAPVYARSPIDNAQKVDVLIDPLTWKKDTGKVSLSYAVPSTSGRYVAFGLTYNDSEYSTLLILDTRTNKIIDGQLENTKENTISFSADERTFTYVQYEKTAEGLKNPKVYLHEIGRPFEHDPIVFENGGDYPAVIFSTKSDYAVAIAHTGTSAQRLMFVKSRSDLPLLKKKWQPFVDEKDAVTRYGWGNNLWFTMKDTDARQIIYKHFFKAEEPVTEIFYEVPADLQIDSFDAGYDAFYAIARKGMRSVFLEISYDGVKVQERTAPPSVTYTGLESMTGGPGFLVLEMSGTQPTHYSFNFKAFEPFKLEKEPFELEIIEDEATGHDGVKIPISIVKRKDQKLTPDTPALMKVYGSYGVSRIPSYEPSALTWLDLGGIEINCHIRGGGELGTAWHRMGQRKNKINGAKDTVACLEHVIRKAYTSAEKLGIYSVSAGGIPLSYVLAKRPELVKALVISAGVTSILRSHRTPTGTANVAEYGDVANPEEFKAMLELDGYELLQRKSSFPSTLFAIGFYDNRVPPWMSAKSAARMETLQSGKNPILVRTDFESGHGISSGARSRVELWTDIFIFLKKELIESR